MNKQSNEQANVKKQARSRSGCLRCRVRRRKCDERRPVCRNCEQKNFECNYGVRLSFLDSNAEVLQREHLSATQFPGSYGNLQFVCERIEDNSEPHASPQDRAATRESFSQAPSISALSSDEAATAPAASRGSDSDERSAVARMLLQLSPVGEEGPNEVHSHNPGDIERATVSKTSATICGHSGRFSASPSNDSPIHQCSSGQTYASHLEDIPQNRLRDVRGTSMPSEARRLELLRYWRYEVAPWLDMCNLKLHFGLFLATTVDVDKAIYYALLLLSSCHESLLRPSRAIGEEHQILLDSSDRLHQEAEEFSRPQDLIVKVFRSLRDMLLSPPSHWKMNEGESFLGLPIYWPKILENNFESSCFWTLYRLNVVSALANVQRQVKCWILPATQIDDYLQLSHDQMGIFTYSNALLLMCAQVLNLIHDWHEADSLNDELYHHNPTTSWTTLHNRLESWYRSRPFSLQPIFESNQQPSHQRSDQPTSSPIFQTILFTLPTGILTNCIYHATSIILLQSRPRTLKLRPRRPPAPPTLSIHWHAQRICGMSGSIERRIQWDFAMVAALLVAGRYMTHEEQQGEVVSILQRCRDTTGWKLEEEIGKMKEEWTIAAGED